MNSISRKRDKQRSNNHLKKVEKKVFNEDLVEIGELNPLSTDQKETPADVQKPSKLTSI